MPTQTTRSSRFTAEQALALWQQYRATGDLRLRNRLVMAYTPLVRYIVYKKIRELPARCEAEDFVSCGLEALIASIERYDPEKGATLEQYAWTRIQGSVLDELRRQDWAPRSLRRWEREIARARERYVLEHECRPTDAQLAAAMSIELAELRRHLDDIALSDVSSLNAQVVADDETTVERIDTLTAADDRLDPEHVTATNDAKARFRAAFAALPEREREIAAMLYVDNLTLREIGERLGVSESRVCQLHTALRKRLRTDLAPHAALLADVG